MQQLACSGSMVCCSTAVVRSLCCDCRGSCLSLSLSLSLCVFTVSQASAPSQAVAGGADPEQDKFLDDANESVKKQAFYMKVGPARARCGARMRIEQRQAKRTLQAADLSCPVCALSALPRRQQPARGPQMCQRHDWRAAHCKAVAQELLRALYVARRRATRLLHAAAEAFC